MIHGEAEQEWARVHGDNAGTLAIVVGNNWEHVAVEFRRTSQARVLLLGPPGKANAKIPKHRGPPTSLEEMVAARRREGRTVVVAAFSAALVRLDGSTLPELVKGASDEVLEAWWAAHQLVEVVAEQGAETLARMNELAALAEAARDDAPNLAGAVDGAGPTETFRGEEDIARDLASVIDAAVEDGVLVQPGAPVAASSHEPAPKPPRARKRRGT